MWAFAALAANNSRALMALGYRHMKGLGVPKSCESAALYYIAAADQVVSAVQHPGELVPVRSPLAPQCLCQGSQGCERLDGIATAPSIVDMCHSSALFPGLSISARASSLISLYIFWPCSRITLQHRSVCCMCSERALTCQMLCSQSEGD